MVFGWDDAGGAVLSGIIGAGASNTQADIARQNARIQREIANRAYQQQERRFSTGRQDLASGESALMGELSQAPQEMNQYRKSLIGGQTEAQRQNLAQTKLGLAQQGVRGGQAQTLLNRSVGGLNKDLSREVDQMAYQDALRRSGLRTGYLGQKALSGQSMAGSV